jgi:hypothetical protein
MRAALLVPKSRLVGPLQDRHLQTQAAARLLCYDAQRTVLAQITPHKATE